MLRASRALRLWSICWAVLQLLLPPLASLADGVMEREGVAARIAHVEAVGDRECPPAHAADCAVCRQLGAAGVAAAERSPLPATPVRGDFREAPTDAATRDWPTAGLPRAPPVLG